jgi:hypothetical protein
MNCDSCAQCHYAFGYSERGIIAFSNGKCAHAGDCANKYQQRTKNKGLRVVSYDAKASQGFVVVGNYVPVVSQVSASG